MVTDAQGQERQAGPVNLSGGAAISTRSNGKMGARRPAPQSGCTFQDGRARWSSSRWPGCVQAARSRSPGSPLSPRDARTRLRRTRLVGTGRVPATSAVACRSRPHRLETPEVPPWECGCLQMSPFPAGLLPTAPEGGLVGVDEQLSEMRDRTEPGGRRVAGLLRGSRAKGVRSVPASSSAVQHSSHR